MSITHASVQFAGKAAPAAGFSSLERYGYGGYGRVAFSTVLRARNIEESSVRRYFYFANEC